MKISDLIKNYPWLNNNKNESAAFLQFLKSSNKYKAYYKTGVFGDTLDDSVCAAAVYDYAQFTQFRAAEAARAAEAERIKKVALANMLITSGFTFDGYTITKYSGYISGDDAISVNREGAFSNNSNTRDELLKSLVELRRNALQELKEAAYNLGCNAVIGVDFDYLTLDPQSAGLTGGTVYYPYVFCVTANGNAVVIQKNA